MQVEQPDKESRPPWPISSLVRNKRWPQRELSLVTGTCVCGQRKNAEDERRPESNKKESEIKIK